ncbi:MAG: hypothetical protein C0393_08270 [Anaerolinea sp.]|nr:hypothetical protein [Anaerolinea sp.]
MPEKGRVYEAQVITQLTLKTAASETPSPRTEKRWQRPAQKSQKSKQEMIGIVLRLIEYFENCE